MDASRIRQTALYDEALRALAMFDDRADPLRGIARLIIERRN
jgi:hypothetical protein